MQSTCSIGQRTAVLSGLKKACTTTAARSLIVAFPQVTGRIAWLKLVVRDRIELSTTRMVRIVTEAALSPHGRKLQTNRALIPTAREVSVWFLHAGQLQV